MVANPRCPLISNPVPSNTASQPKPEPGVPLPVSRPAPATGAKDTLRRFSFSALGTDCLVLFVCPDLARAEATARKPVKPRGAWG